MPNLTLNDVAAKFNQWRSNRPNKRGRIPNKLLALVPPLKKHYKVSLIAKTLNLSGKHMKKIFTLTTAVNFIELPCPAEVDNRMASNVTCEFVRGDGTTLKIVVINTEVPALIKEFLCCN